ncbi:glycine/betaine ABC transporter ATP-binding protein, partial [Streptomyces sp. NPDC002790]
IAVMRDGRIVQIGSAEDILVTPANDYVASFTRDVDRSRVLSASAIMAEPGEGYAMADAPARVHQDTPIVELFAPCSTSAIPVAVVDDEGELVGVVPRERLLAVLGEPMKTVENGTDAAASGLTEDESAEKVNAGA